MFLLLRKLYLYFTKDPEAVHYFLGRGGGGGVGVVQLFPGGGVKMLISIDTHIRTCYFPGGVSGPPIPLWIRTRVMSSLRDNIYHSPASNHNCQALICQD